MLLPSVPSFQFFKIPNTEWVNLESLGVHLLPDQSNVLLNSATAHPIDDNCWSGLKQKSTKTQNDVCILGFFKKNFTDDPYLLSGKNNIKLQSG